MTPAYCRVTHDPANGSYGDCIRACVASLLDIANADDVPHFYHDNDAEAGHRRMIDWLCGRGYAPFFVHYDGATPLPDVLAMMGDNNPSSHYMLVGGTVEGNHAVICHGGEIVHNPSWFANPIIQPPVNGIWSIMVIARA